MQVIKCTDGELLVDTNRFERLVRKSAVLSDMFTLFGEETTPQIMCGTTVFQQLLELDDSETLSSASIVPVELEHIEKVKAIAKLMLGANVYGLMNIVDKCAQELAKLVERNVRLTTQILMSDDI